MKPIIFSTPMARAVLEGKKNMTRRVINWRAGRVTFLPHTDPYNDKNVIIKGFSFNPKKDYGHAFNVAAHYKAGDILWVREAFAKTEDGKYIYRADPIFDGTDKGGFAWSWNPSIHIPKEAARLFLEVKNVRVERVQDISERDVVREGITILSFVRPDEKTKLKFRGGTFITEFKHHWDSLNAKRGYSWENNPWVWVIEFMRTEK
jgi:hypothetical protein